MGTKLAPRFKRLRLENWKNFRRVDVPLQRRVFMVGPNASGKSNLLDAIRFLRDLASPGGGFREAVSRRGGVSAVRNLAARRNPDIQIAVTVDSGEGSPCWDYELHFHQDKQKRPMVRKETVKRDGEILLSRPCKDDQNDRERLTQTHLEQVNVNRAFRGLVSVFESVRYLHIVPQLMREPDRSVGRTNDPFGGDFLEQVAKTQDRPRNARMRKIQSALKVAVPQLRDVELTRDERGTPHLRGKYEHWRPQGAWQTEEQFSDGTLRLLGLLWALMDGSGPLLLEEPELSLHPEIIRYLPQMFARTQGRSGRQLLVSTHSSDLLRDEGIGLDEVLMLRPGREGTEVSSASRIDDVSILLDKGMSLAEVIIPQTRPQKGSQLTLFGDAW